MNTHCLLRPIHFWFFVFAGICCYALPGLISHAPWKPDDAVHIGLALNQIKHGLSWFPALAGRPWVADGQLTAWTSALTAKALISIWPFEMAGLIRLPNLVYLAVLMGLSMRVGNRYNDLYGKFALPLLIIGGVGCWYLRMKPAPHYRRHVVDDQLLWDDSQHSLPESGRPAFRVIHQ